MGVTTTCEERSSPECVTDSFRVQGLFRPVEAGIKVDEVDLVEIEVHDDVEGTEALSGRCTELRLGELSWYSFLLWERQKFAALFPGDRPLSSTQTERF